MDVEKNFTSSWTEKRTNLSVLEEVKPKRSLEATNLRLSYAILATLGERKGHWSGTLCLDKSQDTGGRENHKYDMI